MWRPCSTVLDKPVLILGLEMEDLLILIVVLLVFTLPLGMFWASLATAAGGVGLRYWKRDRPSGAVIEDLYGAGVVSIPGMLKAGPQARSPWPEVD